MIGVDVEVADRGAGQILAQRLPVIAVVEADVDGGLGAGEEQAGLLGIGAQTVHPASGALVAGQAVDDADPGLAAVGGAPDERHVSVHVGGQGSAAIGGYAAGDVGGIGVGACLDGVEAGVGRYVRDVADVVPGFAAIEGVVDLAVAAHGPDHTAFDRGDGEVVDGGWGRRECAAAPSRLRLRLRRRLWLRRRLSRCLWLWLRRRLWLSLRLWFRLLHTAGYLGRALGGGQVGACGGEGLGSVARDQQALVGDVESAGFKGDVELLLEVPAGGVLFGIRAEVGRDVLPLPGGHIDLDEAAAASARAVADAVDDVGVFGVGRDDAELRRGHRVPVSEVDLAPVAAAADHHCAGVLLRSHDAVGILVVGGDVVDLRDGLGVPEAPGLAVIKGDAGALVGADEHAM